MPHYIKRLLPGTRLETRSFVYRVNCGQEQAILKLNRTEREVCCKPFGSC